MSRDYLSEKIAQAKSDIEANIWLNKNSDSLETIFAEITEERKRQDEMHPWDKLEILLPCEEEVEYHGKEADIHKLDNDMAETLGKTEPMSLLAEELHEIFAETDPVKQETEAIQLAALAIKFVQWSRSKRS